MASFNKLILMGNLTRDPEQRQSQSGTLIAKFGLAVNDRVPDGQGGWKEEVSFIDCVVFGKRAESFCRFMHKGKSVLVEGKIRQDRWQDKETGQNRSKLGMIVDNWEFAGGQDQQQQQQRPPGQGGGYPQGGAPQGGAPQGGGYPQQQQQQQQTQQPVQQPQQAPQQQQAPGFPPQQQGGFPDDVPF